jgi:hypothetical protein
MTPYRLTPLWASLPRAHQAQPQQSPSFVALKDPDPTPAAPVPAESRIELLTVDDLRVASISTINAVLPYNRKVIAQAVIDSGPRRRGELETPMTSLKPIARFILLADERRRGRELTEEEAEFMTEFPASVGAA